MTFRSADLAYAGLLAAGLSVSIAIGFVGLDFGSHWDEPNTLDEVARAVRTGLLLPRWYNYPGFTFDLSLAGLVPTAMRALARHGFDLRAVSGDLSGFVASDAYHLRLRLLCLLVTQLGGLGAFGALLALGHRTRDAAACGLLLLSSWQIAYHARWVAPDDLMMAATAVFVPLSIAACRRPNVRFWARLAAASLGVVVSCKYPGGLLVVPFLSCLAVRLVRVEGWRLGAAAREIALAAAIAAAVFVAITPGAYVEPLRVLRDVDVERLHYTVSGHGAHTIRALWPRFVTIARFLLLDCFSPYAIVAWCFAIAVPLGALSLFGRDRLAFAVVVGPAALGLLYFSSVDVVLVRNYLFLFPSMAILATSGAFSIVDRLPWRRGRIVATAVPFLLVAANFAFGAQAAYGIRDRGSVDFGLALRAYLGDCPPGSVYVAPSALGLAGLTAADLPGAAATLRASDRVVYDAEQFDWDRQYSHLSAHALVNRPGTYTIVAGPSEVDWDYYPDWLGGHRLIALRTKDYERLASY